MKPRHIGLRRECRSIARAVARLEARMLRLFPGADGKPGNDDPVTETLIGLGQASIYVEMIPALSDAGIESALLRHGRDPATEDEERR